MAKAQGAPAEEIRALQEKARATSADIDQFCEDTGRARHRDREGVYTQRSFPSKDTYDVAQFERTQKEQIEQFYQSGGAQKQYQAGVMQPKNTVVPNTSTPPAAQPTAQQTAQPQDKATEQAKLDAANFPDEFNKKKTKAFVDAVNATEGVDPDVVELFNKMGIQVDEAGYPITISYTEDNHAVTNYVYSISGKRAKIVVKVPKLADAEYLRQEIGTTAHEWGHLFDHMNSESGVFSYSYNNGALPNALKNARPMSERVKNMVDTAIREAKAAEKAVFDAAKGEMDSLRAEMSEAFNNRDFTEYRRLSKQRDKVWKEASKEASKASRKAHNGVNAIEDIYDAISGGKLRDSTSGLYGHGSKYYGNNPGGENAATETIANYCNLALAYPELFQMMAEEQPEIWEACGDIIKAMIGG